MKVINRVKKYPEFQEVINKGQNLKVNTLNCYFLKNSLGYTRFGISIPTKSGHAVVRNKMKRQIRAAIAMKCDYKLPFDIVIIARNKFDIENFEQTKADIEELLKKVG